MSASPASASRSPTPRRWTASRSPLSVVFAAVSPSSENLLSGRFACARGFGHRHLAALAGAVAAGLGFAAPRAPQLFAQRDRHPGRCRAGAGGRRLLLDGPRRAGAAARRLHRGAHLAANSCRRCARACTARSRSPISNGPASHQHADHRAVARDRRAGDRRQRSPPRSRARRYTPRLAHLDLRRAAVRRVAVRRAAAIAACAA